MPTTFSYGYPDLSEVHREAQRQVLAKFPGIMVGSSGFHRAMQDRIRKLRRRQ